jgi:lipopolysaccharide biosynthesis regulator YciM
MKFIVFSYLVLLLASQTNATISPRTYNALNEIQESLAEQPTTEELKELEEELLTLSEGLTGNSTGLALTFQILAQVKDSQGLEKEALKYIKSAYYLPDLNDDTKSQLAVSLGYLYYAQEQYQDTVELFNTYIKNSKKDVSATVYALLAGAYFAQEKFSEGLPHIEKACELADTPKEQWLNNAFSANYRQKNYRRALKYANDLVFHFPHKKQYWTQKASIHQFFEEYSKAASITELSNKQGYLEKESQYFNLGVLLASEGAPFEVATSIENAINSGTIKSTEKIERLLSMAWVLAKEYEKAKLVLTKLFNSYQDKKDGLQLLSYEIDDESWERSIELSNQLMELELSSKEKGNVLLMKGISLYRSGNPKQALINLGKASAIDSISSQAKSWMNYIKQMEG